MLSKAKEALAINGDATTKLQWLMEAIKAQRPEFHWVGIYFLQGSMLHVGPYAGPITEHVLIPVGRGVCGTAVAEDTNQIVDDVSARGNYLACNLETQSEIVVLIRDDDGRVVAQFDIDATKKAAFTAQDEQELSEVGRRVLPLILEARLKALT